MQEQKQIRVIVADDHRILRQGLKMLLAADTAIEIVGEAESGSGLLELLAHCPADVVLMGIHMPVMDGYEATEQLVNLYPDTKVIALSMLNNVPYVHKMLSCGASGYLLKTTGKDELRSAIKLVAGGITYISSELSIRMMASAFDQKADLDPEPGERIGLSKREIEVLELIAEGFTNSEIADKLFTSKRTIETHRQNILDKTGAKNSANLIKYAIKHQIIKLELPG